jgi:hypothetical protein
VPARQTVPGWGRIHGKSKLRVGRFLSDRLSQLGRDSHYAYRTHEAPFYGLRKTRIAPGRACPNWRCATIRFSRSNLPYL